MKEGRAKTAIRENPQQPGNGGYRVGMVSLGCPKNLVDSERMLGQLREAGFAITPHPEQADLLLVNTCAFVRAAQEESVETILELSRYKDKEPGRCQALVVVGCLPQRFGEELKRRMPEVDAWMGVGGIAGVAKLCREALAGGGGSGKLLQGAGASADEPEEDLPRLLCTPPHYAYLKVAEGCRNSCSYCVIPSLRGNLRSRPLPSLLREAKGLVGRGVRELILIAQDLGNYGKDLEPPVRLSKLLEGLCRIDGLEWIRLLYLHPAHVPKELARIMVEEPKICPYLDLPLQHIDDRILRAMNRGVTSARIWHLIEELRSGIPHLRLRTTVMVGFPGESEKQFSALLDFIRKVEFDHLGAFAYSREEGTPAARMKGHIPQAVKERRLREVMEAQAEISHKKNEALIGTRQRVLVDQAIPSPEPSSEPFPKPSPEPSPEPSWRGRMSGQAPEIDGVVYVRSKAGTAGEFMEVEIIEADTYDLVGRRLV